MKIQINNNIPADYLRFGGTDVSHGEVRAHMADVDVATRRRRAEQIEAERQQRFNQDW